MQVTTSVNNTHILLIITDDLNKVTHDVGEEGNTTKHDDHCNYSFSAAHWEIVTITHCTKGSEGIIATNNELVSITLVSKLILGNPGHSSSHFAVVEPEATNEVSNNHSNDDQSEDFINIHHHILCNNLLVSGLVFAAHQ